ncbi:MAG TPA: thioredoxin domain-containing protein, partial [Egibacteraceae bacterium]|nr:thioredoxin domain-containing protein [Egibacteraceae bacterium]
DNPVDWFEWSEAAFDAARAHDKPIFLSVGYSACHWCHVMAHESFEDPEVAEQLNRDFVSIKVDREERPDIDAVYMAAVQALTGHGGWPMSVFLTPEGVPFFGGTYWPKEPRHGMPGFPQVLEAVRSAWRNQRADVVESGKRLAEQLRASQEVASEAAPVDESVAATAAEGCVRLWDVRLGGFGPAPKFPHAMTIDFLLAHHLRTDEERALRAAAHTLDAMSRGGIYDHVGGGFARYSVDERWLVPHFEKMLYDNALLLRAYTHGWQVTGDERFRRVAAETADYLLAEMRHPGGGFYSATDADSEGVEGKFFVWSKAEFAEVVASAGEDPADWEAFFGVSEGGNFEGANILHEAGGREESDPAFSKRLAAVRSALYERRRHRVPPGLDDKILTSWNALAIGALAEAGAALGAQRYVEAARTSAEFLAAELVVDGQLRHAWKDGHGARVGAFLEDVSYLAQALLVLAESDPDDRWISWAVQLATDAEARFADGDTDAYFTTAHDAEALVSRPVELWDNATPAGSSVMADVHLRLAGLTGDQAHARNAERTLARFAQRAVQAPTGYGELLRAMERLLAGPREVAIVGDPGEDRTKSLIEVYREAWRPGSVLAVGEPDGAAAVPLLSGRGRVEGRPAAYVCRLFACERPVTEPEDLRALLAR